MTWRQALGADVPAMVALTQRDFEQEADQIFQTDPTVLAHNLTRAVVDQFYNPGTACLWIHTQQDHLQGYVWAERGQRAVWSADEMVAVKIIHLDLNLAARERVRLIQGMLEIVENWTRSIGVPIICSTTMRGEQQGFLRLHERQGYERRGSICYKRLV